MAKERDYAGEPRSEANPLRHIKDGDAYEKSVQKGPVGKNVEGKLRDQGDSGSDNDAGLSSKLPK